MGCAASTPASADESGAVRLDGDRRGGRLRGRRARGGGEGGRGEGEGDGTNGEGARGRRARVKLVLLGASAAGKTALSARYVRDDFLPECKATVGAAFASHAVRLEPEDVTCKFEIWDTAGQERYQSLAPLYYRGATAALIVFDVTSEESFERARYWAEELSRHGDEACRTLLVGNKSDLEDERVENVVESAEALAAEYGMVGYVETSAKENVGVREAFELVARAVVFREEEDA